MTSRQAESSYRDRTSAPLPSCAHTSTPITRFHGSTETAKGSPTYGVYEYNFAPTPNSFNVLADLDDTYPIPPAASNSLTPSGNLRQRRKRGKMRYKKRKQGADHGILLIPESTGVCWRRSAGIAIEGAGSLAPEDFEITNHGRRLSEANTISCFANDMSYCSKRPQTDITMFSHTCTGPPPESQASKLHPNVYSCSSLALTPVSRINSSIAPQFSLRLCRSLQPFDAHDTLGRCPSKFQFLQPPSVHKVPRALNDLPALTLSSTSGKPSATTFFSKSTPSTCAIASCIGLLRKQDPDLLPHTLVPMQELNFDHAYYECAANDSRAALLTTSSAGDEAGNEYFGFFQEETDCPTCDCCSFSQPCHTSLLESTTTEPLHEIPANPAFTGLQFTTESAPHIDFEEYMAPVLPIEPLSAFYPYQQENSSESPSFPGLSYFPDPHGNLALMDYLGRSQIMVPDSPFASSPQDCETRDKNVPFLSQTSEHSTMGDNKTRTPCPGIIPNPARPVTTKHSRNHEAQQVDSIFANRDPHVKGRLYSASARPSKHSWLHLGIITSPSGPASTPGSSRREEVYSYPSDHTEDIEPIQEWIHVFRQYKQRSSSPTQFFLRRRPARWHRASRISYDDYWKLLVKSATCSADEASHSAKSDLKAYSSESMDDSDDNSSIRSNEEYEIVQRRIEDCPLQEWEVMSPFLERTSFL